MRKFFRMGSMDSFSSSISSLPIHPAADLEVSDATVLGFQTKVGTPKKDDFLQRNKHKLVVTVEEESGEALHEGTKAVIPNKNFIKMLDVQLQSPKSPGKFMQQMGVSSLDVFDTWLLKSADESTVATPALSKNWGKILPTPQASARQRKRSSSQWAKMDRIFLQRKREKSSMKIQAVFRGHLARNDVFSKLSKHAAWMILDMPGSTRGYFRARWLYEILRETAFFSNELTVSQGVMACFAASHASVARGEWICRIGELVDCAWIIVDGVVDVYGDSRHIIYGSSVASLGHPRRASKLEKGDRELYLESRSPGNWFGEPPFYMDAEGQVVVGYSVKCSAQCARVRLLEIPFCFGFNKKKLDDAMTRADRMMGVSLFSSERNARMIRETVGRFSKEEIYPSMGMVVSEGEKSKGVWIVIKGSCVLRKKVVDKDVKEDGDVSDEIKVALYNEMADKAVDGSAVLTAPVKLPQKIGRKTRMLLMNNNSEEKRVIVPKRKYLSVAHVVEKNVFGLVEALLKKPFSYSVHTAAPSTVLYYISIRDLLRIIPPSSQPSLKKQAHLHYEWLQQRFVSVDSSLNIDPKLPQIEIIEESEEKKEMVEEDNNNDDNNNNNELIQHGGTDIESTFIPDALMHDLKKNAMASIKSMLKESIPTEIEQREAEVLGTKPKGRKMTIDPAVHMTAGICANLHAGRWGGSKIFKNVIEPMNPVSQDLSEKDGFEKLAKQQLSVADQCLQPWIYSMVSEAESEYAKANREKNGLIRPALDAENRITGRFSCSITMDSSQLPTAATTIQNKKLPRPPARAKNSEYCQLSPAQSRVLLVHAAGVSKAKKDITATSLDDKSLLGLTSKKELESNNQVLWKNILPPLKLDVVKQMQGSDEEDLLDSETGSIDVNIDMSSPPRRSDEEKRAKGSQSHRVVSLSKKEENHNAPHSSRFDPVTEVPKHFTFLTAMEAHQFAKPEPRHQGGPGRRRR